jgi:hypothetical protein
MNRDALLLGLIEEGYARKTWHGPNLRQALKGITAKQAAWRPDADRHNIWELVVHAAYWKYVVRRKIEGGKRGSFVLEGSNFFARPERGSGGEAAWRNDQRLLENEHRALVEAMQKVLGTRRAEKLVPMIYGVAFHDVYHAGQVRLLRRLMDR